MKNLYTIILCLFFFSVQAQNYYYNGSEKIEISQSKKSFISYDNPTQKFTKGFKNVKTFSTKGFSIVEEEKSDIVARKFRKENLTQTIPALLLDSNSDFKLFPTKTIRIKLRTGRNKADISKLLKSNDFTEMEEKYGIFRVTVKDIRKVLEIANKIYESDIAEFSLPDFYIPMELNQVNDPLFPWQFQMHNTGQVIDGVAGIYDMDVNALEAWNLSLGDDVTVAVFDQGMEYHEDFGDRLIRGYTPATDGNGTPLQNDATHGMNCAGIIGASHDDLGLRGVAPNVNFLSVNIFAEGTTIGDTADGIQWAINNGADVLSNSWGYIDAPCGWTHIDIENALQNAVNNGRNGNGAVIVFAAGNSGGCVSYPASSNNVISVGAVDNRGVLFRYSSRGPELDLVAPSGRTGFLGNVRTTDRMGDTGRLLGNYEPKFGGTSASCPVVSGVAALVLSVNPNLTQQRVRDILTSTATDMGVVGFDNNFGFGRVNAFAAVVNAFPNIQLTGSNTVCSSNTYYSLSQVPNGVSVHWSVSSNLQIVNSTNTTTGVTVKAMNSTLGNGLGVVRATIGGTRVLTKNVWVGRPNIYTFNSDGTRNYLSRSYLYLVSHYSIGEINVYTDTPNTSFSWDVSPNNLVWWGSPGGNIIFNTDIGGHYWITAKATNECGESIQYHTLNLVGSTIPYFTISPNPASFNITINNVNKNQKLKSSRTLEEEITYEFYDLNSSLKLKGHLKKSGDINISSLKKGLYILKIISDKKVENHRVIIE